MQTDINFISSILAWATNLSALVIAVLYCYRDINPHYLRIFPPYLLVSIGTELLANRTLTNIFHYLPFGDNQQFATHALYNLFTMFEVFMFAWFMFKIIQSPGIKKILTGLLALFTIFFVLSSLGQDLGNHSNDVAVTFESIIIIIPCLAYFRELFSRQEPVDLIKEPSFWLVTGILFYLTTIFPLFLAGAYLKTHCLEKTADGLYSINNFSLSVTFVLFIRGYTCRIRK